MRSNRNYEDVDVNRETASCVVIGIIAVLLLIFISLAIGFGVKKFEVNANREIFKDSTAYTEAAANFLATEYREYNQAETDVEKTAIMEYVAQRYPNLDSSKIEDREIRAFYKDCLYGGK